jgi:hypothetical protein
LEIAASDYYGLRKARVMKTNKIRNVPLSVDAELLAAVDVAAYKQKQSRSFMMREAIKKGLNIGNAITAKEPIETYVFNRTEFLAQAPGSPGCIEGVVLSNGEVRSSMFFFMDILTVTLYANKPAVVEMINRKPMLVYLV